MTSHHNATAARRANDHARAEEKVIRLSDRKGSRSDHPSGIMKENGTRDHRINRDQPITDPCRQLDFPRQMAREWLRTLPHAQVIMLLYFWGKSTSYGNEACTLTHRSIELGDDWADGTGFGRTYSKQLMRSLEAQGAIRTEYVSGDCKMTIRLNLDWNPAPDMARAKRARHAKTAEKPLAPGHNSDPLPVTIVTPSRSLLRPPPGHNSDPFIEQPEGQLNRTIEEPGTPADADGRHADAVVSRVRFRSRPTASALPASPALAASPPSPPVAPAPPPNLTEDRNSLEPGAIERTMRRAFERLFADKPGVAWTPWTERDHRCASIIVNGIVRRYEHFNAEGYSWGPPPSAEDLHEFIEWAVENWWNQPGLCKLSLLPDVQTLAFSVWGVWLEFLFRDEEVAAA